MKPYSHAARSVATLRAANADLKARLSKAERERDDLSHQYEVLCGMADMLKAERDQCRAELERLLRSNP